jgi:enoyl-CoA hydratase
MPVRVEKNGPVTTIVLARPEVRNAVDRETAYTLAEAFKEFDQDPGASIGVFFGDNGSFCAGADLKAIAAGKPNRTVPTGVGPMGPSRLLLS